MLTKSRNRIASAYDAMHVLPASKWRFPFRFSVRHIESVIFQILEVALVKLARPFYRTRSVRTRSAFSFFISGTSCRQISVTAYSAAQPNERDEVEDARRRDVSECRLKLKEATPTKREDGARSTEKGRRFE